MKTFTKCLLAVFTFGMVTHYAIAQSQINFVGYVSQGEGIAGWNANGSGPEPAATGHLVPAPGFTNQYYYGSSHDYITGNTDHGCAHFLPGSTGFPEFDQVLADNGYTMDQVKMKYGLTSLEDDIEGIDWFFFNDHSYSNYYGVYFIFELDGQPLLAGLFDYANMYINTLAGNWQTETGYSPLHNVATGGNMIAIANAFLSDLDGKEIKVHYESTYGMAFSGNGRTGAYYNVINGVLETGYPQMPCKGLTAENEGSAAWDADGTGPEPYGNGHQTMLYYCASVDYDDINPDTDACLAHFLDGSAGFFNTMIQLQYRGFTIGDFRVKMGLASFGPDVQGEDWGVENGHDWVHEYNNVFTFEINGEPILQMLQDTMKMVYYNSYWTLNTSIGKVYDISQNASPEAQFVAQSFLRDLGTHYLEWDIPNLTYAGSFSGNGRNGAYYQINSGALTGIHEQATFVSDGTVSGTWTLDGSPYYVEGHLLVEDGQTLEIDPGVRVAIRGPYPITVEGNIVAVGTTDNPIMFTASNPNIYWDGLDYEGDSIISQNPSVFDHCIFQYGRAGGGSEYNSGGIFAVRDYDDIEIYNSTFRHNIADLFNTTYVTCGGAIALWNASPFIQKCIFYDNYALDYAGAILAYMGSEPIISNCLFYENESERGGALAFYENSNGKVINSTIVENTALFGGGLYFYSQSSPEIINTMLWNNEASNAGNQVYFSTGLSIPGFYYCDIEEGAAGFGGTMFIGDYLFNIDENPIFSGNGEHPFSLQAESPCYNSGTPDTSAWFYDEYLPETCICGNLRILNGRIDIGAYELLITGIEQRNEAISFFTVQPNPIRNVAHFNFELSENEMVKIELYNYLGQKLDEPFNAFQSAGSYSLPVNLEELQQGTYIAKITKGQQIYITKFIKY